MTDRERLLQILNVAIFPHEGEDPMEAVTDYLLDNGVTFGAAVPGHENNYDISEMAYNNGYAKGCEDSKPKWIPVSERLPEDDLPKDSKRKSIKVLVTYKTSNGVPVVRTQVREKEPWFNSKGWDWTKAEPITHWMPLPEPPKENANEVH